MNKQLCVTKANSIIKKMIPGSAGMSGKGISFNCTRSAIFTCSEMIHKQLYKHFIKDSHIIIVDMQKEFES